ncbi:hypothetical protein GCM10025857_32440 [Alicyclobacillus contaminans]|uniref:hypothetical protein n=1 Tax=Alicyclobacillus contaminans TaxID=392016 RepID=UPI000409E157|nr:hypothetical protein [Alicyclobacillus contaminans]GMA51887.1 hypothetical protein GCM10025857_32440 [Alicyclobacillus contaminans]
MNRSLRRYVIPTAAISIFALLTGCSSSSGGGSPVNNTVVSGPSNQTDNSAPPTTNSPSANIPSPARESGIHSNADAVKLVQTLFQSQLAKDKNLMIQVDHTSTEAGHTVYSVHVFDSTSNHVATIAWVDVRDDGMVRDGIARDAWTTPSDYQSKHA